MAEKLFHRRPEIANCVFFLPFALTATLFIRGGINRKEIDAALSLSP